MLGQKQCPCETTCHMTTGAGAILLDCHTLLMSTSKTHRPRNMHVPRTTAHPHVYLSTKRCYIHLLPNWDKVHVCHTDSGATESHLHWSGGPQGTVKTVLNVVNECVHEEHRLGGSGGMPPRIFLNFRPSKIAPGAILGHNSPRSYSCLTSQ